MARRERRRTSPWRAVAVACAALLISSGLVFRASLAAFTATTTNPGDHWASGTVALADDDSGTARFSATGMVPGSANASGTKCLTVSYSGTVTADVRMYVLAADYTDTGLGQYLTFTVEEGTGGSFANCAGFSAGATVYGPGTLATFASTYHSFGTGFSSWQPTGADTRTYRITYTLQDNNAAQGKSVDAVFTWEADSV